MLKTINKKVNIINKKYKYLFQAITNLKFPTGNIPIPTDIPMMKGKNKNMSGNEWLSNNASHTYP